MIKEGYLIATHSKYMDVTLPVLIPSIPENRKKDFIIYVNDGGNYNTKYLYGIETRYVPYNAFEYTVFIETLKREEEFTHVFLVMDTTKLGPNFFNLAEKFNPNLDATGVDGGECNFAMYRTDYLHSKKDYINSLISVDKTREVEEEGNLYRMSNNRNPYPNSGQTIMGYEDVYGNGTTRQLCYYQAVDLMKYKSNWKWPDPGKEWFLVP